MEAVPAQYDTRDDAVFDHNLEEPSRAVLANSVRDVANDLDFWVAQVFGAYEAGDAEDGDAIVGSPEKYLLGWVADAGDDLHTKPGSTAFVFLETIRDMKTDLAGIVAEDKLRKRTVLHEMMHVFYYPDHDTGVMDLDTLTKGSDAQNVLSDAQLKRIMLAYPGLY